MAYVKKNIPDFTLVTLIITWTKKSNHIAIWLLMLKSTKAQLFARWRLGANWCIQHSRVSVFMLSYAGIVVSIRVLFIEICPNLPICSTSPALPYLTLNIQDTMWLLSRLLILNCALKSGPIIYLYFYMREKYIALTEHFLQQYCLRLW